MLQDFMAKFLVLVTALFMLFGTGSLFFNAFQFLRLGVDASKEKKTEILKWMGIMVGVMVFVVLVSYFFNDFLFNEILLKGKGTTLLQATGDLWKAFTESIPTPKQ